MTGETAQKVDEGREGENVLVGLGKCSTGEADAGDPGERVWEG